MKIHNFDQYSDSWWEIRKKKMTASHAQAIAANGAGLKTYILDIMQPIFSKAEPKKYSNKTMERGLELEPEADMIYQFTTGIETKQVGFVVHDDHTGCSPDRFASIDGLTEMKCPEDKAYFKLLLDHKIETKYEWQMQMQMFVCEKKWCDYVVYNPNFKQQIFIERVFVDPKKIEKLRLGFVAGKKMIKEIENKMGKAA